MFSTFSRIAILISVLAVSLGTVAITANADHSWGGYHWKRSANPLQLDLGDNLSASWDPYLSTTSADWSASSVLDTTIVRGGTSATKGKFTPKNCVPTAGRVEICNATYGNTGWLGVAQIWVSGSHILQSTVKLNDTYFKTTKYNTAAWKNFVMCQEVGHAFGLDHQDEDHANVNIGTCMDYTNDPTGTKGTNGTLNNEHPNAHDYEELELIYAHADGDSATAGGAASAPAEVLETGDHPGAWGEEIRRDHSGRGAMYARELGNGKKVLTFVVWAAR